MRHRGRLLRPIAALALGLMSGAANATVIFTDFGPGDAFADTGRVASSGTNPSDPSRNSPGYSFIAPSTASISEIDVGFNSITGSVIIGLFAAVPYTGIGHGLPGFGTIQPGAQLGEWTVAKTGNQVVESITGITGITLTAGTGYFLLLSVDRSDRNDAVWGDNSTGVESALYQCGDSDPVCAFGNISLAGVTTGAFDVLGSTVVAPEPGSLWLVGVALGGLGLLGLRRPRRACGLPAAA